MSEIPGASEARHRLPPFLEDPPTEETFTIKDIMRDYIAPHVVKRFARKGHRWASRSEGMLLNADPRFYPSSFHIVSWNIDFMGHHVITRLHTILDHIKRQLPKRADGVKPVPCCILLQELHIDAFPALLSHPWVKEHFQIVPTTPEEWPIGARYGVVTLISRSMWVERAQSLYFGRSGMRRSALMVDIRMNVTSLRKNGDMITPTGEVPVPEVVVLRLANVHLESLPQGAALRPAQLGMTATLLREADCGVVCGDMNAIGPSDVDLHTYAGLEDAWKRGEEDAAGWTWGYQPRCEYSAGRLDKILYTPSEVLEVDEPRRVGVGLKTADGQWASDHYGLTTVVRVV